MEQNTMGVMLFYYREKHKLSQEQVCEGICSVATLSRVEQGVREIDSLMSETLLGRIGKEVTLFEIMLDEEDYCRWKIRDEIVKEVERGDYERALKHIEQYRVLAVDASDIHEQFLQFYELKIIISRGEKKEKIGQLAKAILKLTMPKYGRIRERSVLYSPIEIQLVLIMIEYDGTGDIRQKEARLLELLAYIDEYYSDRKKEEESIEILRVLIAQKWKADDMKDILSYTDWAISLIGNGRGVCYLGEMHFLKAQILERIWSSTKEWNIKIKECKQECMMAYCVYSVEKNTMKKRKEIINYCEKRLGWQITDLVR